MNEPKQNAEFDHYASGYDDGIHGLLKSCEEEGADVFVDLKAAWVHRFLQKENSGSQASLAMLDFGCGTGRFLQALQRTGLKAIIEGSDISSKMLEEARRTWDPSLPVPPLHHTPAGKLPFATHTFDVVTACCVFHHIPPGEWLETARELRRILKPGGRLLILEHNPWNPLTRWIVYRCPIDKNAVLLSVNQSLALLREAGFKDLHKNFLLFFPPRFRTLWKFERLIGWIPLGCQYVAGGRAG